MKRVLLGIIFCLLIRNMANAGDAWVLWNYTLGPSKGMTDETWRVLSAYPNYEMCMKAQQSETNRRIEMYKTQGEKINPAPFGFFSVGKEGGTYYSLKCLPETVDPRERK